MKNSRKFVTRLDLLEAASQLVNRIDKVHGDPQYQAVWIHYANHGHEYGGLTFRHELEILRAAIKASKLEVQEGPK